MKEIKNTSKPEHEAMVQTLLFFSENINIFKINELDKVEEW